MSDEGAVLFARYAYPPNALGYCGPAGADSMLNPAAIADIARRAERFEGAWSYLEFIAESLGIVDPLSVDVVSAYWVGNDLLGAVDPAALVARLEHRFVGQPGGTWRSASDRARAHHTFQVYEVYPWAGLLRADRPPGPAVNVLDRCRIRTGTVRAVNDESITVTTSPLVWQGGVLRASTEVTETAQWSVAGRALIEAPAVGDVVALHWDWVCDVLTPDQARLVSELDESQRIAVGLTPAAA